MSIELSGPHPFDSKAPAASVADLLRRWVAQGSALRSPQRAGREPGLYLVLEHRDGAPKERALVRGFWIVFGSNYLEDGPSGPPDRVPPFVRPILDAVTEAVWWKALRVAPLEGRTWKPILVFEWPQFLSSRSSVILPGVAEEQVFESSDERSEHGRWLLESEPHPARRPTPGESTASPAPELNLPRERSILCIVRARLTHDTRSHVGSFTLLLANQVPAELLPVPLERWLQLEPQATGPLEPGRLGVPLELPAGGVGFPLSGWLTRSLEPWPSRVEDILPGDLVPRDVRSEVSTRARMALGLTAFVVFPTLLLAFAIRLIATTSAEDALVEPAPDAQPAISTCSADHKRFVEQFRCQIAAMVNRDCSDPLRPCIEEPVCEERGSKWNFRDPQEDLQPSFCGLLARSVALPDIPKEEQGSLGEFVAAQACFDVLGFPEPYKLGTTDAHRELADPRRFLDYEETAIQPLRQLIKELHEACSAYTVFTEARVQGAVFATYVGEGLEVEGEEPEVCGAPGGPVHESACLRREVAREALEKENEDFRTCFQEGMRHGVEAPSFQRMCWSEIPENLIPMPSGTGKMWTELGYNPADQTTPLLESSVDQGRHDAITRYFDARFGKRDPGSEQGLWSCHQRLGWGRSAGTLEDAWRIGFTSPLVYNVRSGLLRSQLELDSALMSFRGGGSPEPCWNVVAGRLVDYAPVHPLLGELAKESPFRADVQLCAQTCAARYRIVESPRRDRWYTQGSDLALCVDSRYVNHPTPGESEEQANEAQRLRDAAQWRGLDLPWNREGKKRIQPVAEDICAFHLVAQSMIPLEGGVLVEGLNGAMWAGVTQAETESGGIAVQSARNMSTSGRNRSRETCAHVATQCFTSVLLGVARENPLMRSRWLTAWNQAVAGFANREKESFADLREKPWCKVLLPYITPGGELPEGQFDYPCAKGVADARTLMEKAAQELSRGLGTEGRP